MQYKCPTILTNTCPLKIVGDANNSPSAFLEGVTLNLTSMWQLLTQIDGLAFADVLLAVPQNGLVVAA